MPGLSLGGDYAAFKYVERCKNHSDPGMEDHEIFTGLNRLLEGITKARLLGYNA